MLDHPSLSSKTPHSLLVCAKAKLLASDYLLHRTFDLKPSESLLAHCPTSCDQSDSFYLTALELAVDAVKLLWRLSDHRHVRNTAGTMSCNVLAWNILLTLLKGLRFTVRVQCHHNLMLEASYYAREGAMLAKSLHLKGW